MSITFPTEVVFDAAPVSFILYSVDVLPHFALNSLVFVFLGAAKGRLPSRSIETFSFAFVP